MATNLARTSGIMESDAARDSGLATSVHQTHCVSAQTMIVNAQVLTTTTDWLALTLAGKTNHFAHTLVAQVIQGTPSNCTLQLRVRGYDQFHTYIEEITPVINLVNKTNNFVYLAKTFAHVVSVDYKSSIADIATGTLSLGQRFDWTRTIDATNHHHNGRNLGLALPMRVGQHLDLAAPGTTARFSQPQGPRHSAGLIAVGGLPLPERQRLGSRNAFQSVTIAAALDNDTLVIDGVTYTFKTAIAATAGHVLIGGSNIETANNLRSAINRTEGAGTTYGANTVVHPTVQSSYADSAGIVSLQAKRPGAYGNTIPVVLTSTAIAILDQAGGLIIGSGSSTLIWGGDYPCEILGMVVSDITGAASAGAITSLDPTMFTIGYSEAGWQGSLEKVHILKQASVAQWAVADNIVITMTVRSAETKL